ncbi:hypothetical protein BD769DRAFT_1393065 [Suillus cothurnatus]|nr:hypothetical protein BD769DRAFT_1393065 [Suillus cothurnatus]
MDTGLCIIIAPPSAPPQQLPFNPSNANYSTSPASDSPMSSKVTAMSSVSETDHKGNFPTTTDFNHSCSRPQANHDNQLGSPNIKTNDSDVFLRCLDGLTGLVSGCKLVHYKETIHGHKCPCLFTTYWELEETNRLQTLFASLYMEQTWTSIEQIKKHKCY